MSDSDMSPEFTRWQQVAQDLWDAVEHLDHTLQPIVVCFELKDADPTTGNNVAAAVAEATGCVTQLRNRGTKADPDWHISGRSTARVFTGDSFAQLCRQVWEAISTYDLRFAGMSYELPGDELTR